MLKIRNSLILQYINPKKLSFFDEEKIKDFGGGLKKHIQCKAIFMNAVLQSSNSNHEIFSLNETDLGWYFNTPKHMILKRLEKHNINYKEDHQYKELSDKWTEKFCGFDGVDNNELYRNILSNVSKTYSERICKKLVDMGIEYGYIDADNFELTEEELKTARNE